MAARLTRPWPASARFASFLSDQERLITEFGTEIGWWQVLTPMGPIAVQKWKIDSRKLGHEVVVERWKLPDKSDLVELSIKVEPCEASVAADAFITFLEAALGVEVEGDQQTKTRGALTFFTTGQGFESIHHLGSLSLPLGEGYDAGVSKHATGGRGGTGSRSCRLQFLGAATTVTGSQFLLHHRSRPCGHRLRPLPGLAVGIGAQPRAPRRTTRARSTPSSSRTPTLTTAARCPVVVQAGFAGPVLPHAATAELAAAGAARQRQGPARAGPSRREARVDAGATRRPRAELWAALRQAGRGRDPGRDVEDDAADHEADLGAAATIADARTWSPLYDVDDAEAAAALFRPSTYGRRARGRPRHPCHVPGRRPHPWFGHHRAGRGGGRGPARRSSSRATWGGPARPSCATPR